MIGVGRFGREHVRVLAGMPEVDLQGVFDAHQDRAAEAAEKFGTRHFERLEDLFHAVEAVTVAAPTFLHHEIGLQCISRGIHCFMEKPIAQNPAEAQDLVASARRRNLVLQAGHIERFNPAYVAAAGRVHRPKFIEARRTSPFRYRSADIDVVLDIMIHDLDLVLAHSPEEPRHVEAVGGSVLFAHSDWADARLEFPSGLVAHLFASRVSDGVERSVRFFQDDGFVFIDMQRRKATAGRYRAALLEARKRTASVTRPSHEELSLIPEPLYDMESLPVPEYEPLAAELKSFVASVSTGAPIAVSGEQTLRVMRVAAAIQEQVRAHGRS